MAIAPRTTTITVRWRPTPKVYNFNIALLASLEDQKRLRAFKVGDDTTHGLVSDDIELAITPRSISVAYSDGFPEDSALVSIFSETLEVLKPRVTQFHAGFQHLVEMVGFTSYDQARSTGASRIFGALTDDLSLTDSATLIDGSLRNSSSTFTAEFGIVDKTEAAERLSHMKSRSGGDDEPDFSHVSWEDQSLPDIALYVDSHWHDHEEVPVDLTGRWLFDRLRKLRVDSDGLAEKLFNRVAQGEL